MAKLVRALKTQIPTTMVPRPVATCLPELMKFPTMIEQAQ
jgi:hypothetical protein